MIRLVSLALVLASLYVFDANPRALLFAFILTTLAQVLLVKSFLHWGRTLGFRTFVEGRTRAPTAAETKWARDYVKLENAATSLTSILLLIGGLALFAFMLAHVNQDKELDFNFATFSEEMALAAALTLIYVLETLVLRDTALDLDQPEAVNFHYGSQRITVLAFAVLFAGAAIAFLQATGKEISPWVLMGPLIVLKHGFDLKHAA